MRKQKMQWILRAAVLGAMLLTAGNTWADMSILSLSASQVTVTAGDLGDWFDVSVTNTGDTAATVAGFGFGLAVNNAALTLQDATIGATNYIFAGNSFFGPEIGVSGDGQSLLAFDIFGGADPGVVVNPGASFGLGRVFFDVAAGAAPGSYDIMFSSDNAATDFSDPDGNAIPIGTLTDGSITIEASPLPEPSMWLLVGAGLLAMVWWKARLARRSN